MMRIQSVTSSFVIGTLLVLALSYVAAGDRARSALYKPANNAAAITEASATVAGKNQAGIPPVRVHVDENGSVWLRLSDSAKTKAEADLIQTIEQHSEAANSINRLIRIGSSPLLVGRRANSTRS